MEQIWNIYNLYNLYLYRRRRLGRMERSYMSEVSSCEVERVTVRQNYTRVARAREVMRISPRKHQVIKCLVHKWINKQWNLKIYKPQNINIEFPCCKVLLALLVHCLLTFKIEKRNIMIFSDWSNLFSVKPREYNVLYIHHQKLNKKH